MEEEHGVAGDHDQFAVRKVDQPHDPEDQGDAKRDEGIDAAEAESVDNVLKELSHRSLPGRPPPGLRHQHHPGCRRARSSHDVARMRARSLGASERQIVQRARPYALACEARRAPRRRDRRFSARAPAKARRGEARLARSSAHARSRAVAAHPPTGDRPALPRAVQRSGKISSTLDSSSPFCQRPNREAPSNKFSLTVSEAKMFRPSGTSDMPRSTIASGFSPRILSPLSLMSPCAGTAPAIAMSRLVLPAPLGPTIPTYSPSSTVRDTPFSAVIPP